jgi:hypothetical protein
MPSLQLIIYSLVETTQFELQKQLLLLDIDKDSWLAEGATLLPAIN